MDQRSITNGPPDADWTFLFAHGAGAPMDTPFMETIATGLADADVRVVRFEFPYMKKRRETGGRRPPDRMPVLLETFHEVMAGSSANRLAIGGKSMGGRVASLLAAEGSRADRVVCLGYPFHPPGKPEKVRTEHLETQATPTLIVQGTRDPFGTPIEVAGYPLSDQIQLVWLEDGEHSFKPRVKSGHTLEGHLETAVDAIVSFLRG